jgi:hypothetical protein
MKRDDVTEDWRILHNGEGACGSVVVKAPRCKPEGRGFASR